MVQHFQDYSIHKCPKCGIDKFYKSKNHYRTSKEAERKKRLCKSCSNSGENNPCYGRTGSKHPFYGKVRPSHSKQMKENNPMFDSNTRDLYFLAQFGLTAEEWANTKDQRYLYILEVIRETKKQDLTKLIDYDKLGHIRENGYHLDHIYPKSKGFDNNIPPELIGDIRNLRIIPGIDNVKKGATIIEIPEHIKQFLKENGRRKKA